MKTVIAIAVLFTIMLLSPSVLLADSREGDSMPDAKHYLIKLLGTRDGWPGDMTDEEFKIMQEHFAYLKDLTAKKKVIAAGPVSDEFGLIILQVSSEEEAREIMKNEPSVAQGVHKYEMSPMVLSLLAHYIPDDRYAGDPTGRIMEKEVIVTGTLDEVWKTWTTSEGVKSFLSPYAHVDLKIGGPFEIYFDMSAEPGLRGSEDCKILSYLPHRMLSFEWNAPPSLGKMRGIHTHVVMLFEEIGEGKIRVDFSHLGWGEGEDWDKVYQYFDRAWSYVLGNFKKRMEEGPIKWE